MKKRLSLLLAIFLIFSMVAVPSAAASYETLKIGLYYGTNALSAANLQNVSEQATGYQLGYYDTSRNFIPLYSTNEMYITVVKDKNMYIGDGKVYYDSLPSSYNTVIGAYHLQLDTVASSLDEALALISTLSNAGLSAFVAYTAEGYRVRVGNYTSSVEAASIAPQVSAAVGLTASAVGESRSCYTVTVTETNTILFEFDMGGQALSIEPNSDETWFKNQTYYGGFEYRRASGDDITVVNVVSMDDYIKGVIPYEMSPSWPIEALKAQALCAKSYAVTCIGKHNSQGFDLCNTTDCQVYYGTKTATDNSDSAVEAVSGLYVLYNGEVAETYYHASSGGWTEDAKNIWGTDIPYLKAVEDTYLTELRPYSFSITLSEVTSILQGKGYDVTDIIDFYVSEYTSAGNVREITFVQSNGETLVFSGERARTCLNTSSSTKRINSHRYTVSTDAQLYVNGTVPDKAIGQYYAIGGDGSTSVLSGSQLYAVNGNKTTSQIDMSGSGSGQYVISGTGSGHNIGMSQCGARDMANQGFTYDQIIQFYFTGVQVGPAN
ncbi:MAG TPA: SpoIID/LytB domain-containing protein [Candidatus Ventrousia excrementavium]|uniref:SpoIID/LytB domain-containing protein n=1 Tax=Candidatus Ventrousia excrementavium TaxID=2840961 RepID=A0A9D1IVD7_9CLOT|nr:SpoIID/LytB domain-containing protein [Candidatus Ventrousia excrementavium]